MLEIIPNWHPIFVHFTVALFSLAVGLFVVTPFMKSPLQEQWQIVARWALWFGAGFTVITGLTGLLAYNTVAHDTPSHAAMTDHRNWAIVTIVLFFAITIWSIVRVRRQQVLGTVFVITMIVSGVLLASTAWRGGEVVYRYGLGVLSLPKTEGEVHSHEHANDSGHNTENKPVLDISAQGIVDEHHGDNNHNNTQLPVGSVIDGQDAAKNEPALLPNGHHDDGHDHKH